GAFGMIELVRVAIERSQSANVGLLPLSFGFEFFGMHNQIMAALQIGLQRTPPELVVQAHRLAPVRHGARWVLLGNFLELVVRRLIFKRVQERHATFKWLLYRRGTGSRECHIAELFSRRQMRMVVVGKQTRG